MLYKEPYKKTISKWILGAHHRFPLCHHQVNGFSLHLFAFIECQASHLAFILLPSLCSVLLHQHTFLTNSCFCWCVNWNRVKVVEIVLLLLLILRVLLLLVYTTVQFSIQFNLHFRIGEFKFPEGAIPSSFPICVLKLELVYTHMLNIFEEHVQNKMNRNLNSE